MRRKPLFFLPLLIAMVLLSLPEAVGREARLLSLSFVPVWKSVHSEGSLAQNEKEFFHNFFLTRMQQDAKSVAETSRVLQERGIPQALVGRVIYRPMGTYMNFIWLDVGQDDNPKDRSPIIAKNSPVVTSQGVVGVIDCVGKKSSICRLITDSNLSVAVRVKRGKEEEEYCRRNIEEVRSFVTTRARFDDKKEALFSLLDQLEKTFSQEKSENLAKGELIGLKEPTAQGVHIVLRGVGFNYSFADRYGPKRSLAPVEHQGEKTALIQSGDILVTSGLDAIFPEGLPVAKVLKVLPLEEGAISYELTATPSVPLLSEISSVVILPPEGIDLPASKN